LIHYRIQHENTLERISECNFPTEFGDFRLYAYQDQNDNKLHLALVMGQVAGDDPVLVRVHGRNLLDDLFSSKRNENSVSLRDAMRIIADEGRGVIVVIRQNEDNKSLVEHIHQYQMQDNGVVNPASTDSVGDWRSTGTGSRILADLGVHRLKVIGTQKKYVGLAGFDLEVVDYVGKNGI
jgi:3,4-dihydroxy 2-butanone 4-phosphate synthase/GTP cyclohydrolase II